MGLGLRLAWILAGSGQDRFLMGDSASYLDLATSFPGSLWPEDPALQTMSVYRTPGYPIFLWFASLGDPSRLAHVVLVQAVIGGVANVWLCHRLADRIFGSRVAFAAALLLAVDPVSISHSLLIVTETICTTFLLAGSLNLERSRRATRTRAALGPALAAGALLGAGALVRPVLLYLIPIMAVWALWSRLRERSTATLAPAASFGVALLFLLGAVVPTGAWLTRNRALTGRWVYSTVQGQDLLDYGIGAAAAERGGLRLRYEPTDPGDLALAREAEAVLASVQVEADAALAARGDRAASAVEVRRMAEMDAVSSRRGIELLADHPRGAAMLGAYGATRLLVAPGATQNISQLHPKLRAAPIRWGIWIWASLWVLVVNLGAVAGLAFLRTARRPWQPMLLVLPLAYYLAASSGSLAHARFRIVISPILCILAASALLAATDRVHRRSRGARSRASAPDPCSEPPRRRADPAADGTS